MGRENLRPLAIITLTLIHSRVSIRCRTISERYQPECGRCADGAFAGGLRPARDPALGAPVVGNITSTGEVADDCTAVQSLIAAYISAHNDLAALSLQMSFDETGQFEMGATENTPQWVKDAFACAQIIEQAAIKADDKENRS